MTIIADFMEALQRAGLPVEECTSLERVEFWRLLSRSEGKKYRKILGRYRRLSPLTKRQLELLEMAARGMGNKEIAYRLGTSISTVRNQFTDLYARLDARDRAQAVYLGIRLGIISV